MPLAHVFARIIQVGYIQSGGAPGADVNTLADGLGEFRPTFLLTVPGVPEDLRALREQRSDDVTDGPLHQRGMHGAAGVDGAAGGVAAVQTARGRVSGMVGNGTTLLDAMAHVSPPVTLRNRPTDLHQLKNMCLLLLTVIASYLAFGVPEPPAWCPSNPQLPPLA